MASPGIPDPTTTAHPAAGTDLAAAAADVQDPQRGLRAVAALRRLTDELELKQVEAALAAGLTTVVTVSAYTADEDFTGAALVVTSLGDPDGEPARVLADPLQLGVTDLVTLEHLSRLIRRPEE